MRTEKQMYDLILGIAEKDERIRAVILNGSRTNPNVKKDIFQDFDIVYLVTETGSFIEDKNWPDIFGEELIFQFPDENDTVWDMPMDFSTSYGYLMQFTDGNRIDLHIQTKETVVRELLEDKLSVVLMDKDKALPPISEPSDSDYYVKKPTQQQFNACANEFWWLSPYVTKGLWRDEILFSMEFLNKYQRNELLKMLSWYAGIQTDFSLSVGKACKYIRRYLPAEKWDKLMKTFPTGNIESVWEALFISCELFDETAEQVASALGLTYRRRDAQACIAYAKHIRNLPPDAAEII